MLILSASLVLNTWDWPGSKLRRYSSYNLRNSSTHCTYKEQVLCPQNASSAKVSPSSLVSMICISVPSHPS
jgi:hypothetical protein